MAATSHRKQILKNITAFIKKQKDESREEAEAKSFWDDFFQAFGIVRKEITAFEYSVIRDDNSKGYIDLFSQYRGSSLGTFIGGSSHLQFPNGQSRQD